ncbi:MAG: hypothetical protein ABSC30_12935 [Acidimicrobiales bacterium]
MTESKSPGDRLLEVAVFGPAGLAVTLVEEFPKLVEKGRHRVQGQVHTARLVGQVAVQMGRRQLEATIAHFGGQPDGHGTETHADRPEHGADDAEAGPGSHEAVPGAGAAPASPPAPGAPRHEPTAPPWRRPPWLGDGGGNGTGSPASLAIPGYDSLSASQVVQRLEGLSSPELEEVRAHEAAHRQRRTILHRVEQLLTGGDDVPS